MALYVSALSTRLTAPTHNCFLKKERKNERKWMDWSNWYSSHSLEEDGGVVKHAVESCQSVGPFLPLLHSEEHGFTKLSQFWQLSLQLFSASGVPLLIHPVRSLAQLACDLLFLLLIHDSQILVLIQLILDREKKNELDLLYIEKNSWPKMEKQINFEVIIAVITVV